ncbi:hypothetical protein SDJN02_27386, partial [Cucurbita argyrosperma subsp. argyrosperma]
MCNSSSSISFSVLNSCRKLLLGLAILVQWTGGLWHPPELEASLFQTAEPEKDANNKAPDLDVKALDLSVF